MRIRFNGAIVLAVPTVLVVAVLAGCHRDRDCCCDGVVTDAQPVKASPPQAESTPPKTQSGPSVSSNAAAAPKVTGKWIGTWESNGHKGHGGGLKCEATEAGPGKWEAIFTAEYGPTKSYNVKLEGKLVNGAVHFGGKVNLGPRDGDFTWTGEATQTAFKGKYQGGGDTGSFQMVRAPN